MPQKRQFERPTCGEPRMVEKESLDGAIHVIHAIVSLFTCGFWVLVWLAHAMSAEGAFRCTRCGTSFD